MTREVSVRAAGAVDGERLQARHEQLRAIGAVGLTGVSREAFTEADFEARRLVSSWAAERGYPLVMDDIGNLFIRRPGREETLAPIVTGSHLDSQPAGGAFDGAFGVLAAFEALEALDGASVVTRRPVEVAIWANEEGSRFQPTTMGSAVYVGALPLQEALQATDSAGISAGQALRQQELSPLSLGRREFGVPFAAYVEAHIEQGPILESVDVPIGVVTAIQGLRWFTVRVTGQAGHAGTTPMGARRDAVAASVAMIHELSRAMTDAEDRVRFTVGRLDVSPNSPNTIPSTAIFTVDFRHPDASVLARLGDQVAPICMANACGCTVSVSETMNAAPTVLDPAITETIRDTARALALDCVDIVSGATHDAKQMALACPTGMIFIPCRDGISHSVLEHAEPHQMLAGARVLTGVIATLASDSAGPAPFPPSSLTLQGHKGRG
jgi:N-carbamoyl-L-amino-acid hydrolase